MFLEKDEMKFAILYALRQYPHPLSLTRITELMTWDENVMSYFDLTIMLSELIEDGFIERLYYRDEECVRLTGKGVDADGFFSGRVPPSIRARIRSVASREDFDEKTNPNSVTAVTEPLGEGRYAAALTMLDRGEPMLELKIDAGNRVQAGRTARLLKKNAAEIYKYICKTLDENGQD